MAPECDSCIFLLAITKMIHWEGSQQDPAWLQGCCWGSRSVWSSACGGLLTAAICTGSDWLAERSTNILDSWWKVTEHGIKKLIQHEQPWPGPGGAAGCFPWDKPSTPTLGSLLESWSESVAHRLGEGNATCSGILAWRIPRAEVPCGCSLCGRQQLQTTEQLATSTCGPWEGSGGRG